MAPPILAVRQASKPVATIIVSDRASTPRNTFNLATIAPRLARARDDHNRHAALHHTLRIQLVRAYATGDARYIRARQFKLASSQRTVARLRKPVA